MLTRTGKFLEEKSLIRDGDRILCMVSGGADSTAMLYLLNQLSGEDNPEFEGTFSLGICHVNYGRRGESSNEDEVFVRQLGDRMQMPVHVIQAPRGQRPNFQAWARDFRYLAARNLCHWQGYTRIAVAHNRDDRIETFLYRLMTYSGRRSLVVMPPLKGRIIRPLLFATAVEIRNFCVEDGLAYREDETNDSLDYARNRIRQLLIPQLARIRPDFRDRITDTISLLEDEDAVLRSVTDDFWRRAATEPAEPGTTSLRVAEVAAMPRATARLVVRRWLSDAKIRARVSRRLLDSIVSLCRRPGGTGSISLSEGLQVERRYDRLVLASPVAATAGTGSSRSDHAASDSLEAGASEAPLTGVRREEPGQTLEKENAVALDIPGKILFGDFEIEAVESPDWDLQESSSLRITIDRDRLTGPLMVRSWLPGDRFRQLGLGGSKSVQDLFTDEKVPRPERKRIPVVVCGDRIVWVCGLRMSEEFKVADISRRLIGIKATRRAIERAV
ncbi:MAG: tRNA lysidine(34) synthetase TilS [Thermoleophilia bacterium]|nr:tRNA lysidine(34) synthetase TilS [Thermoleophilia bacterium]